MNRDSQEPEVWYTLGEAAKRLNVHPTTLRRWANNGDIPVMVTPGGHRRFAAGDITRFAREHRVTPYTNGIAGLFATQALAHARQDVVVKRDEKWLTKFDNEARNRNRMLGQQLMGLTLQFLSSEDDSEIILEQARQIGHEYARNAMAEGIPMKATLEASMFFRDSLIETALQLPDTANIRPEANVRLLRRVNTLLNAVHLAVAEAYDDAR
jgi:excisionase family DNA binding protein